MRSVSERNWVLPDEPAAVRLMNTVWADRAGVHEALDSPSALGDWLVEVAGTAIRPRVTTGDLTAALTLRDALRRLAAGVTEDDRSTAASATASEAQALSDLNEVLAATHVPPALERGPHGLQRSLAVRGGAVTRVLATVSLEALDLLVSPSPLRACRAPGCVLYFVKDHPRREWCSEGCGNRVRAARHYARSKTRV